MPLLRRDEIESILSTNLFYEDQLVYVIDPETKTYQTDVPYENLVEYASHVKNEYKKGRTIIVKGLEFYNLPIRHQAAHYGPMVDVHMYLVPNNGDCSFDYHIDERSVYVHLLYGEKTFYFKEKDRETRYDLIEGDSLHIPLDQVHKAIPEGESCLLSFGLPTPRLSYEVIENFGIKEF